MSEDWYLRKRESKQMEKKEKLIEVLSKLNDSDITDFYFHHNWTTGELELNIELHNMETDRWDEVKGGYKEIDSSAFWE